MSDRITDLWFRSELPLGEIAKRLGLRGVREDAENYWAWVVGALAGERIDVARTHTRPAGDAETRVFLLSGLPLEEGLLAEVVARLQAFVPGPISAGRWQYRSGEDFELVPVREYLPPRRREPPPDSCPTCGGRNVRPILWGWRFLDAESKAAADAGRVILGCRHESGVRGGRDIPANHPEVLGVPDWACLDCEPGWAEVHRLALQDEDVWSAKEEAVHSQDFATAFDYLKQQDEITDRIVEVVHRLTSPRPDARPGG